MKDPQILFLAWQDPERRAWLPIGRLTRQGTTFTFQYTRGAHKALESGFQPLLCFQDLNKSYESESLLPVFANRVLSPARADFREYADCLNLPLDENDPLMILARSGGRKVTDSLEVFPYPDRDNNGKYHTHFFLHGLRHRPKESLSRIETLEPGERLWLAHDIQNSFDPNALFLRSGDEPEKEGSYLLGYLPRYLAPDLLKLLKVCSPSEVVVKVERVNPPPAPLQLRLLCNVTACIPAGFEPFSDDIYKPIVEETLAASVA